MAATRHLGLDLGGTNIKWVVLERSGDDWRVLDRGRQPTPAGGPTAVLARLAAVGKDAAAAWANISTVGIGVPGLYYPESGATRFLVNFEGDWDGVPVQAYVGRALGLPATLINDARGFGLAELRLGAGRGASSMVGFVLGTGVGGVVAVDGHVYQGHDGTAGELGHMTIDPDGPRCNCGNFGCLEAFIRADRLAEACGTDTAEEAETRARAGDERAREGLARVGRYLGIGIANAIVTITPDRVVIGGGVAGGLDLMMPALMDELTKRVHVTGLEGVEVVPAELGPWAGGIGAAVYGAENWEAVR